MRHEQALAEYGKLKWQRRGPVSPAEGGPRNWRGQSWREGSGGGTPRWGNRGGRNKEYYAQLAREGKLGKKEEEKKEEKKNEGQYSAPSVAPKLPADI